MEDTSDGKGCAIFLIVAGFGLAAMAIAFGLIIAVFTIDSSETEISPAQEVVEDVIVEESDVQQAPESTESSGEPPSATAPDQIANTTGRIHHSGGSLALHLAESMLAVKLS